MTRTEKTYERLIERFVAWARDRHDIRAAVVIGSQALTDKPRDDWSDLDIMLMTRNPRFYLTTTQWLEDVAKTLLTCEIATPTGYQRARIVWFEGDAQVDFAIVSSYGIRLAAFLLRILARYPQAKRLLPEKLSTQLNAFSQTLCRGVRVLLDKDRVWGRLERLPLQRPIPTHPTEYDFTNLVNKFWHWSIWTSKMLWRNELWLAKSAEHDSKQMLLQMMEWHARSKHGSDYETWYLGRHLERWADPGALMKLRDAFGHYDKEDTWRALFTTMDLFRCLAADTAELLKYPYPAASDEQAMAVIKRLVAQETEKDLRAGA